ncbi:hypothetical protein ACFU6K_36990 [Kitasatospora sp. NPDC057512]|uniref:hypothetical protein n=1 Tax=Kitasatospora sp. NPDC057512 TaxID=3346154 RepID=UPI0036B440CC
MSFVVRCLADGEEVFTLSTVFGFFPVSAFEGRAGCRCRGPTARHWSARRVRGRLHDGARPPLRRPRPAARADAADARPDHRLLASWGGSAVLGRIRVEKDDAGE